MRGSLETEYGFVRVLKEGSSIVFSTKDEDKNKEVGIKDLPWRSRTIRSADHAWFIRHHPQRYTSPLPETGNQTTLARRDGHADLDDSQRSIFQVERRDYIRRHALRVSDIDGAAAVAGKESEWQGCLEIANRAPLTEGLGTGVV